MLKGNSNHDDVSDDDFVSEKQIFQGSNKTILTLESIHVVKGIDKHVKKRIEEGKVYLSDISPVKNAEIEEAFLKSLRDNALKNNIISKKKYYSGTFNKDLNIKIEENYKCFSLGHGQGPGGGHTDAGDPGWHSGSNNLNSPNDSDELDRRPKGKHRVPQRNKDKGEEERGEEAGLEEEKKKYDEDELPNDEDDNDVFNQSEVVDEADESYYNQFNSFFEKGLKSSLLEKFSFNDFPELLERETIDYIKKKERKLQKKRLNANLEALRLQYIPINNDKFKNIPREIKENILALFACIIIKHIESFDDIQLQNHLEELSRNFLKQLSELLVIDPLAYKCIMKPLEQRELIRDITGDKKIYQLYEKPFIDNLLVQIQDLQAGIDLKFKKVVEELNNEMDFWQNDHITDDHNNDLLSDVERDIPYGVDRCYSNSSNLLDDDEEDNGDCRSDGRNLSSARGSFIQREIDESYNGEAIHDYFSWGDNKTIRGFKKTGRGDHPAVHTGCAASSVEAGAREDQSFVDTQSEKKRNKRNPPRNEKRAPSEWHNDGPMMEEAISGIVEEDECNAPPGVSLDSQGETNDNGVTRASGRAVIGERKFRQGEVPNEVASKTANEAPLQDEQEANLGDAHPKETGKSGRTDDTKQCKNGQCPEESKKAKGTGPLQPMVEESGKMNSAKGDSTKGDSKKGECTKVVPDKPSTKGNKNMALERGMSHGNDRQSVGESIQAKIKRSINRSETFEGESDYEESDIDKHLNHGVPTRGPEVKSVLLRDLITTYIMTGNNNARIQLYFQKFARCLKINELLILRIEENLAADLISALQASTNETSKRKNIRRIKIAAAALGGGALIAFTAGLAAPGIIAGLTALGAGGSSLTAFLASASGLAFIVSLFGAGGAGLTGYKYSRRIANIRTFEFMMLNGSLSKSLSVCVCVSGEIQTDEDITNPWIDVFPNCYCDLYALKWENHLLKTLGSLIETMLSQEFAITASRIWLQYTIASTLSAALTWPLALIKYASSLDNVYLLIRERAQQAGRILADALSDKNTVGQRPVILIGYSVGARVIFYCLKYLYAKKMYNIVSNAIFIGLPATTSTRVWEKIRMVVTNRVINVYSKNDWLLGFLYRYMEWKLSVAGLIAVNVPNVENYDASGIIHSHLDYKRKLKDIFNLINFDM
ncbi:conserved protein, unknown function [Plasmodium knowlesi strain H]|uniref:DUF726 domain-containing protein n=3 Tax=Plasmodium knowlesi TaxID=5850 RepID=A0A5K1UAP8_PLAKH|nr:uncharacterized protein PKNH_1305600 [Plasmodium knowlesi strain H]OTN66853.1 Uncharacterized protein PKNOH_S08477100 [Plasmodium knowlesi]CAA9990096.1 conserved protein, unknown function [Plasmodium knowlesi strain H]SBO25767.1 conserved protein, unknown function [Plasmodium knowlesi strain H]SBO28567.1 conserved protein, unknown function [Plasmodium knowlesi strain H]VVS79570.1 conserved protein, unknown function [Plasmodium knowlesi strain H]|eukprot:XP_002260562.1 [Plasmodium knowlesi strain H]